MATQHSAITEANLHENKGVSTAAVDKVAVSNGAGATVWQKLSPKSLSGISSNGSDLQVVRVDGAGNFVLSAIAHGSISFNNIAAPYTLTYPATYTKLAPTTTATTDATEVTEATTARLTYTGTANRHMRILATVSLDQVVGANRDIRLALFKNGVIMPHSAIICTTQSGLKLNFGIVADETSVATNDYFEIWAQNDGGSGDIRIYTYELTIFSIH